jgi:hypothetical protein
MNEPLDPRSAQLLRYERARTDPVEGTKARVFARVQSTLAAPSVQTSNAPPQPPVGPCARDRISRPERCPLGAGRAAPHRADAGPVVGCA